VFSEVGSTGEWPYTNCNTSTRCYQNCPLAIKCGTNFNRFPYGTMPLLRIEYSPLLIDQVNLVSRVTRWIIIKAGHFLRKSRTFNKKAGHFKNSFLTYMYNAILELNLHLILRDRTY